MVDWARAVQQVYGRGAGLDRQDFRLLPTPATNLGDARNNPVELIRVKYSVARTIRYGIFSNKLISVRVELGYPYGMVTFRGDVPGVSGIDSDGAFAFGTLAAASAQIQVVVAQSLRVLVLPQANLAAADRVCGFAAPDQPDLTEQLLDRLYNMLGSGAVLERLR